MSNPALTQFSLLDPHLLAKQIEASFGNEVIFDTFSYLDPLRMQKQIEEEAGKVVFKPKSLLDPGWSPPALAAAIG
jgi:hypothetical protein